MPAQGAQAAWETWLCSDKPPAEPTPLTPAQPRHTIAAAALRSPQPPDVALCGGFGVQEVARVGASYPE